MKVRQYPGESERFLVSSDSRPEVEHIVDIAWVEAPGLMARPACSCERGMAHNEPRKHILAVARYLKLER